MTTTLTHYAAAYENATHESDQPDWLGSVREAALDEFLTRGFPTTRDEEWRFTSVAPIASEPFDLAYGAPGGVTHVPHRMAPHVAAELVFVDGRYAPALSAAGTLPAGVRVESLAAMMGSDEVQSHLTRLAPIRAGSFTALNTAFLDDGAFVLLPPHAVVDAPIHLLFFSTGVEGGRTTMSHPRVLVVAGENSQARIVETYAGHQDRQYFTNGVTEVAAGDGAVVEHYKRQYESTRGFHVAAMHVYAGRNANVSSHSVSLGGAFARNDVVAVLGGEGAECTLDGLYLADGQRLVDNHTTIDHAKPHCGSREMYKGILAGHARGVFNGKVIVRPDAQKTDARQTNRALLLSGDAQINSKPQLEIFANDVKCTHGAAIGQLDDEALFYLRSRGLTAGDARRLLIRAFASEVLARMRLESVRADAEMVLLAQLGRSLDAAA